jgi:hypothetical protein
VWWSGISRPCCRRGRVPGIRGRPIGGSRRRRTPDRVLPLGSQYHQYRRNPLEVIRRDHHVVMAWQSSAPDDRGVEDEPCPDRSPQTSYN